MKTLVPALLFATSIATGMAGAGNLSPIGSSGIGMSSGGAMGGFAGLNQVNCPATPWQTQDKNPATGLLRCVRHVPACPSGFHYSSGSPQDSTGELKCQPDPAPCPKGWAGGMVKGELVCKPDAAPKLNCPGAAPANQANPWGTTYYNQGWQGSSNEIGCLVNNKPAN